MTKDDFIYVEHILESIKKIEKYTGNITIHDFVENELIQDGVIRNFEIIGEATKHLSMDFRDNNSDIPWKQIAGMRDILIHDYLGIDIYAVWETIETNLPQLKRQLLAIKNKIENGNPYEKAIVAREREFDATAKPAAENKLVSKIRD